MDAPVVRNPQQWMQLLRGQQQAMLEAQTRKGQRITSWRPRYEVIQRFNMSRLLRQVHLTEQNGSSPIKSSHVPLPYPPCVEPFANLNKIMIKDLLLETQHRGSYLLVRSVTPQDTLTAVMAVVEDEHGDILMVQLYNQQDKGHILDSVEDVLKQGQVHILKDPYLKLMGDGTHGLRVDHLSDVVFLADGDARIPPNWMSESAQTDRLMSALAWRTRGNDYFNGSKYRSAIECYTRALESSPTPEEARMISCNRSLAFIKTMQFDAALLDVEPYCKVTGSGGEKPAEKALFRKGEALYNLRQYKECHDTFKTLCLEYPNNPRAKTQLKRAVNLLAEHTKGIYQFKQLYTEAEKLRPPHLDHATYIGPVAIRPSGSRGRGLFTTKAVKAGDLLFCEKAFTHAFVDKKGGRGSTEVTVLLESENRIVMGAHADLITMTIRKLYNNPSLLPIITDLHSGSYERVSHSEVDGKPVVDSFLIRRIVSLNSFGCPLTSLSDEKKRDHSTEHETPMDSCGVWPTASYINHSCTSNARRSFIGDMMIARATQDLAPNTELTWWYYPPTLSSSERNKKFQHWGFTCTCALCEDERKTSTTTLGKRNTLVSGLERYLSSSQSKKNIVPKTAAFLKAMSETYALPATEVPRLAVWKTLQKSLVKVLDMQVPPAQLIQTAKLILDALASLGFVIDGGIPGSGSTIVVRHWGLLLDGVVDLWMYLTDMYRLLAPEFVAAAEGYARKAYKIVNGEDETFGSYGE